MIRLDVTLRNAWGSSAVSGARAFMIDADTGAEIVGITVPAIDPGPEATIEFQVKAIPGRRLAIASFEAGGIDGEKTAIFDRIFTIDEILRPDLVFKSLVPDPAIPAPGMPVSWRWTVPRLTHPAFLQQILR